MAAKRAVFFEIEFLRGIPPVFDGGIVASFALRAFERDDNSMTGSHVETPQRECLRDRVGTRRATAIAALNPFCNQIKNDE